MNYADPALWPCTVTRGLLALGLATAAFLSAPTLAPAAACNSFQAAAQVAPPLPPSRDLDAVARDVVALHGVHGGATVNLYHGDLSGQRLYVVVVYPELTRVVDGADLDPGLVRQFIEAHRALLADPRNNVGTWLNPADGRSYLDVSTALPDRAEALALARRYNQMAIFDLFELETIEAGGTGVPLPDLLPANERLPQATPPVARYRNVGRVLLWPYVH